jgi:hypothetical protein
MRSWLDTLKGAPKGIGKTPGHHHGDCHGQGHAEREQIAAQPAIAAESHHDGDAHQSDEARHHGAAARPFAHRQPAERRGKKGGGGVNHRHVGDGGMPQRHQEKNHAR